MARKDLVAVEGWVELQALAKSQPNAAVVHLQVLSVAVLRHHVVRVTRDLAPKEAKLEVGQGLGGI